MDRTLLRVRLRGVAGFGGPISTAFCTDLRPSVLGRLHGSVWTYSIIFLNGPRPG